jgi:hypothetical protein
VGWSAYSFERGVGDFILIDVLRELESWSLSGFQIQVPMRLLRQGATVPVVEWVESNRLSREGIAITKADCTRNLRSCIGNRP